MKRKKGQEHKVYVPETESRYTGTYAVSENGHLADRTFIVLGGSGDGYVLVSDGKKRRISYPKRKKLSHLRLLYKDAEALEMIRQGILTDGVLRKKISEAKKTLQEM